MSATSGTTQNCTAGLALPPWRVATVRPAAGYTLHVTFADGTSGKVLCAGLIGGPRPGVFAELRDTDLFGQVFVDHGAVTWPGGLDLAPDAMYDAIAARGVWQLT